MNRVDGALCGWTIFTYQIGAAQFAVTLWVVDEDGAVLVHPVAVLCANLEEAREHVGAGCTCFPREPEDDPTVVETWM